MADYYNSEGYASPTEHEAFTRIEKEEKAAAKAAAFRPVVYICSPYSGDTERNVENAKRYSRFAVDRRCRLFLNRLSARLPANPLAVDRPVCCCQRRAS